MAVRHSILYWPVSSLLGLISKTAYSFGRVALKKGCFEKSQPRKELMAAPHVEENDQYSKDYIYMVSSSRSTLRSRRSWEARS